MINLKVVGVVAAGVLVFTLGYQFAKALYERDIAEIRAQAEQAARDAETKYRSMEHEKTAEIIKAWEERDAALSSLRGLSAERDRLRDEAASARRRLSDVRADSCRSEREQLARSAELIERGGALVERCVGLSQKLAIDKDAIAKLAK